MPYDEAKWKRDSLAHYLALARIDVPRAAETAVMLASAAEARSAGGLAGLTAALRRELGLPQEDAHADSERGSGGIRRNSNAR